MPITQVEKYGTQVWSDEEMDDLRRERCLCLNCGRIMDCMRAKELLLLCKKNDLALAVTRCPEWIEKKS